MCEKKRKRNTTHKTFTKTHFVQQTDLKSEKKIFKLQGIELDLSMMKKGKLTRTTKTEMFKKSLNIINFKSVRNKEILVININHSILKYKLIKSVSVLLLNKE